MLPILIVLTEGYSDWEIAPLAGLGRAFYGAEIEFVSPDGGTLTSVAGFMLTGIKRFEAPATGVIVICGGPAFEKNEAPDIGERLVTADRNGCILAGICGGTVALARAGLLDHIEHTSNGPGYLEGFAPEYGGADKYIDQPYAQRGGNIITAPAPAPASFAVEVLKAAGLESGTANQIMAMLGREHNH